MAIGSRSKPQKGVRLPADARGEVAKANAARPDLIRELSFLELCKVLLTNEWMRIGSLVGTDPNTDSKGRESDILLNVGVVTALVFTMISISAGDVGDQLEINYNISTETSQNVYTLLSALALIVFVIGVMISLTYYLIIGQCNNNDEVLIFCSGVKLILSMPYFLLILGLAFYVMSQVWLAATILSPPFFWPFLGITILLICFALLGLLITVTHLYKTKYVVGQGFVQGQDSAAANLEMQGKALMQENI